MHLCIRRTLFTETDTGRLLLHRIELEVSGPPQGSIQIGTLSSNYSTSELTKWSLSEGLEGKKAAVTATESGGLTLTRLGFFFREVYLLALPKVILF